MAKNASINYSIGWYILESNNNYLMKTCIIYKKFEDKVLMQNLLYCAVCNTLILMNENFFSCNDMNTSITHLQPNIQLSIMTFSFLKVEQPVCSLLKSNAINVCSFDLQCIDSSYCNQHLLYLLFYFADFEG